jgi:hypothetical protein
MSPERFRRIEELYHAASGATPEERAALLSRMDPELRREVESLLSESNGPEFLDRPAIRNAPELLEDATLTSLRSGACLGPYRIESKLGEGGMGEVFRAVDIRLGRAVAIKTTREQFSSRFEREARAIASLNHPNICTLHDVGPDYLVMELVEGETLAARLKSGPLPPKTALLYASQIAAALVEAHSKSIVHRDLKPANIMLGKSGVKVLDFGLARSGQDETVTGSQMIMGTPAYMAPEQREGKPADARTDIYAFGCVLYEMLAGARVGAAAKVDRTEKAGKNRKPVPGRRPGTKMAIRGRVAAGVGRNQLAKTRDPHDCRLGRGRGIVSRRLPLLKPRAQTQRQGQDCSGGIREQDRRCRIRLDASSRAVSAIGTVPISQSRLGRKYSAGAAPHEASGRD